jgi:hypothetical protein
MENRNTTQTACTKCGIRPRRIDRWGSVDDLCEACEEARVAESYRIAEHHEQHPDECCCHTYLGRPCCTAPIHGEKWRVNGIDNGERFCFFIRAKSRKKAMEVGTEACQCNGEECISVTKVVPDLCLKCGKDCGEQYYRLRKVRGHFCSRDCCVLHAQALTHR